MFQFALDIGLNINKEKSQIFFSFCDIDIQNNIINILGISKGTLPFRFLGIPITCKNPTIRDCMTLMEKISRCLSVWKS